MNKDGIKTNADVNVKNWLTKEYKNCECRNSIVDRLVEECTNVVDENKIYIEALNTTI